MSLLLRVSWILGVVVLAVAGCREGQGPAGEMGTESEGSGASESESESSSGTTGNESETSSGETGPECSASDECPIEAPLCEAGACVSCADARVLDCATERPATPVCRIDDGQCVECSSEDASACSGETPVCVANVCSACWLHADCPASGCNMETGACMPEDRVWYVDADVPVSGDGSNPAPFKTLAEAVAMIDIGEEGTIVVVTKLLHLDSLSAINYRTIALVNHTVAGRIEGWQLPTINIGAWVKVFIDSVELDSSAGKTIDCTWSEVWVRNAKIDTDTLGIYASQCELEIENSQIVGGYGMTMYLDHSTLTMRNSFVGSSGDFDAIQIGNQAEVSILYSTIGGGLPDVPAIRCGQEAGAGSSIRNSLVVSYANTPELVNCSNLELTDSALEGSFGTGNLSLGGVQGSWFEGYFMADFHLTPAIPQTVAGAGVWREGDPRVDIDGDPRPNSEGALDYVGADAPTR